jgi:hypothetical protein
MQVCARRSRRNGLIVMLEITAHFWGSLGPASGRPKAKAAHCGTLTLHWHGLRSCRLGPAQRNCVLWLTWVVETKVQPPGLWVICAVYRGFTWRNIWVRHTHGRGKCGRTSDLGSCVWRCNYNIHTLTFRNVQ